MAPKKTSNILFDLNRMKNKAIIKKIASRPLDLYLFYWLGYRYTEETPPPLRFANYWKGENLFEAYKRIRVVFDFGRLTPVVATPSRRGQIKIQNFTLKLLRLTNKGVRIWNYYSIHLQKFFIRMGLKRTSQKITPTFFLPYFWKAY
ncbi:MAG: hypothetical protein ACFE9S_20395 [Candidatus Hermodarchaeota archaeon]